MTTQGSFCLASDYVPPTSFIPLKAQPEASGCLHSTPVSPRSFGSSFSQLLAQVAAGGGGAQQRTSITLNDATNPMALTVGRSLQALIHSFPCAPD